MHGQEMIHGDLKGVWLRTPVVIPPPNTHFIKANILIDNDGHAQLADFGLLTIISDFTHPATSSSSKGGGTTRWMSPELLDPDRFGLQNGRPTKESDCYALGMVILEVLTGQPPFPQHTPLIAMRKIVDGERPERPQGVEAAWFVSGLWEMLEQCWSPKPNVRPTVEAVLERLERGSKTWQPPPPGTRDKFEADSHDESPFLVNDHPRMFFRSPVFFFGNQSIASVSSGQSLADTSVDHSPAVTPNPGHHCTDLQHQSVRGAMSPSYDSGRLVSWSQSFIVHFVELTFSHQSRFHPTKNQMTTSL